MTHRSDDNGNAPGGPERDDTGAGHGSASAIDADEEGTTTPAAPRSDDESDSTTEPTSDVDAVAEEAERRERAHVAELADRKGPLAWMTRNAVAANLIMVLLIVGGLLMRPNIKQEVFPEVEADIVNISVVYPGASPEEVEEGVVLAIEDAVRGLDGVKNVTATASEGMANVSVELMTDADDDRVKNEIQDAIDRITSFPVNIEDPIVSQVSNRRQVISLILHGDVSERMLRGLGEKVREDLIELDEITLAELTSVRRPEISIEVSQEKLREYDLTFEEVAALVRSSSIDLPGGGVKTRGGEILVRTTERRDFGSEFDDIVVLSQRDGTQVYLSDIATVIDGFEDTDQEAYFNGERAVRVQAYRVGDQTPIEIAFAVKRYAEELRGELPDEVSVSIWRDDSEIYEDRIDLLMRNAYLGLILVLIVLGIFLELRLAFWVTMGIPISFLGTLLFMPMLGVSINMISLFAFILTLGIVVDDAIVVGEAVYKHRKDGLSPMRAAIAGVREVAVPVVFAILTTVIAFTPMLLVPGTMGEFFKNIPMIVITVLMLSLVECLLVLPAHLSHVKGEPKGIIGFVFRMQAGFASLLESAIERVYTPTVRIAVRYRYATLGIAIALLMATAGYVASGRVPFTFMPKVEGDRITVSVRMPFGTAYEETRDVTQHLVETAQETTNEVGSDDDVRGIFAEVGFASAQSFQPGASGSAGTHVSQVMIYLVQAGDRDFTTAEFVQAWRKRVGEVPGVENMSFRFNIGPGTGMPIDIELTHEDVGTLERAAEATADRLESYGGVFDIDSGVQRGKEQLSLRLRPEARSLGITPQNMARQLRGAFFGAEADRQQRGRDELRVYVRRPEEERTSEADIEDMLLITPGGGEIPLYMAADVERGRSYTTIERKNGRRVLHVTADVDTDITTANDVIAKLEEEDIPAVMSRFDGLSYAFGGEQEEQAEAMGSLRTLYFLALIAMFALLAVAFRSYVQPLIIMIAIPFGAIGAIGGHILMGYGMSFISIMGIIALSGVVVNDSLVLIAATNAYRKNGLAPFEAIIKGASRRFRPIMLTTLTTFFGLLPMISETSVQARFLIPMAISLGFGVLFTTVVILGIVPSLYMIIEDARAAAFRVKSYIWGDPESSYEGPPTPGAPGPTAAAEQ